MIYWLQGIDLKKLEKTSYNYVIIDYSKDGSWENKFTKEQIHSLRCSLKSHRTVLAYLSIGEAEDYRFYWGDKWKASSEGKWDGNPAFLGPENEQWKGNYLVDYYDPQWQKIILSYVDIIIEQGFDGIYMDRIDSYYPLESPPHNREDAKKRMVEFVGLISRHARARRPGFKIFVQNGEELVKTDGRINQPYLDAVDGIGREDLFYSFDDKKMHKKTEIRRYLEYLKIFRDQGKTVFTVDYPPKKNKKMIRQIREESRNHGFIPYCGPIELDRIPGDY